MYVWIIIVFYEVLYEKTAASDAKCIENFLLIRQHLFNTPLIFIDIPK